MKHPRYESIDGVVKPKHGVKIDYIPPAYYGKQGSNIKWISLEEFKKTYPKRLVDGLDEK